MGKEITLEITEKEYCIKNVKATISRERIEVEEVTVTKNYMKEGVFPGFRKGKAPLKLIKKKFSSQIENMVMQVLNQEAMEKILKEESLDYISYMPPKEITPIKLDEDKDEYLEMVCNVAPEFKLPTYEGVKLTKPKVEVSDDEINTTIDYYRKIFLDYEDVDDSAKKEDMLKISYSSDFEVPEDANEMLIRQLKSEENTVWLNDPEFFPNIIKDLTGTEKDTEYDLKVAYPSDFKFKELCDKEINYKVKVLNIQRKQTEVSDEVFCTKMNIDSIDVFKEQIKKNSRKQKEQENIGKFKDMAIATVTDKVKKLKVPSFLIDSYIAKELQQLASTLKTQEEVDTFKENQKELTKEAKVIAEHRAKEFLVIRSIAKVENIEADKKEIDKNIEYLSKQYKKSKKEVQELLDKNGGIADITEAIIRNKVSDFIIEKADIK